MIDHSPEATVASLLRLSEENKYRGGPRNLKEARLGILDAWPLGKELMENRASERQELSPANDGADDSIGYADSSASWPVTKCYHL